MYVLGKFKRNWGLYFLTAMSFLAYAGLVGMDRLYGTLRGAHTPQTIAWYLVAFLAYLGALVWVEKRGISSGWMWGMAVVFRLLLLLTAPSLSDDVYRYLWDGYVANEGVSPYAYAIDAPELDYLDIPQRAQANNAWMASPYLPAAQAMFFAVTAVFPLRPLFFQVVMILFDLICAWLIAHLLALAFLPGRRLLIYLWNPLVIVEGAHGAHVDVWMLLLALLAIYFALKRSAVDSDQSTVNSQEPATGIHSSQFTISYSRFFSPFFLALGTLTKILPLLLLPVLFWFWTWWQRIFFAALVVLLAYSFRTALRLGLNR